MNHQDTTTNDSIKILTVYTPREALYYFMDEWEENPDTATVIKRIEYDKPPVVRLGTVRNDLQGDKPRNQTGGANAQSDTNLVSEGDSKNG